MEVPTGQPVVGFPSSDAEAEGQASSGQLVHGGGLLGQLGGAPGWRDQDVGQEADALGDRPGGGETVSSS